MKQRVAIIGANEFQNPLILKAKELGFETHVFAWKSDDTGELTADYFYPISIIEKEAILDKCKEIGIIAIVSIGSDLAVHTVNYVARAMGFPCNSEDSDIRATNKYIMRCALKQAGLPVPKFALCTDEHNILNLKTFSFPLIIKPTDRSGSRGVTKVERIEDVPAAIAAAQEQSFEGNAIIEEFMYGNEYSGESISYKGKHYLLALTKKFTTGAPHFIETGHIQPSDIPEEFKAKIHQTIDRALDALKIEYGASHAEFRIEKNGNIHIIEIGARMGGDCIGSDLVQISTGFDFVKMVIDVACGKEPDFTPVSKPRIAQIRFILEKNDLIEYKRVQKTEPELIWRASKINSVEAGKVTDSSTRFGYYIMAK